jgi:hypothetical protein
MALDIGSDIVIFDLPHHYCMLTLVCNINLVGLMLRQYLCQIIFTLHSLQSPKSGPRHMDITICHPSKSTPQCSIFILSQHEFLSKHRIGMISCNCVILHCPQVWQLDLYCKGIILSFWPHFQIIHMRKTSTMCVVAFVVV